MVCCSEEYKEIKREREKEIKRNKKNKKKTEGKREMDSKNEQNFGSTNLMLLAVFGLDYCRIAFCSFAASAAAQFYFSFCLFACTANDCMHCKH